MEFAEGKMCECNRCGEPMIIGKQVMSQCSGKPMTLPHCEGCTKKRKVTNVENVEAIAEFIERTKTTE
jgi:RNase P subunit RPR2